MALPRGEPKQERTVMKGESDKVAQEESEKVQISITFIFWRSNQNAQRVEEDKREMV